MINRDNGNRESEKIRNPAGHAYLYDLPGACPYGVGTIAVYRQCVFPHTVPDGDMEYFLKSGFRRNGNCLYTMNCWTCKACVPIRLRVSSFKPCRNQRRTIKRNRDVTVSAAPLRINDERLKLCDKFLSMRYPGAGNSADEYYEGFFRNRIATTMEIDYRIKGRLVGTAVIDLGRRWLNAVYFFFDPDEARRSPGTYNILRLIEFCRDRHVDYLYLGYWIAGVRAMHYKANFRPHELLINGEWIAAP